MADDMEVNLKLTISFLFILPISYLFVEYN